MSVKGLLKALREDGMHETAEVAEAWANELKTKYKVPDKVVESIFDRLIITAFNAGANSVVDFDDGSEE